MTAPTVFISYSHKDEEWKDRVVTHLRVLEMEGMLDVWDDRRIELGDDWRPEIEKAINAASIAVLLISANFLTSKFIRDEEVSRFLARRATDGVRVIPLILKPCAWQQVGWLSQIQGRPKDNRPLSAGNENQIDTDLAALANEIATIIKRAGVTPDTKKFIPLPPHKISLAKLPSTSPDLFGREKELKELDEAWSNPKINIVSLVAWGGVGKSALVNKWLSGLGETYGGAERVYGWSFYSQGAAEGRQVSADQFIAAALTWFGDPDPTAGSPWDKGERLAELVKGSRTLLILDGLEPLQNPPPVETGRIKDPALVSFLREVARQNPGLVVISTRLAVDDLKDFKDNSAKEIDLDSLSDESGAAYLKHLGVDGTDKEREQASHDFGGHALALTLLGRYLKVVHNGDIRKRGNIPHVMDEQKQGAHARRVMESYERWLQGKPELDILRLMGLFDRPAEKGALDALRKEPAIPGLTDSLQKLSEANWKFAVNNLRELRLLAPEDPHEPDTLDCHPLLREHFGEKLKTENPKAWQEAHSRLYEYYKSAAKELPDTLEEMAPLFAAIMHGCQAGKHSESMAIYFSRVLRGYREDYLCRQFGAFSSDVSILSNFFDTHWLKPVMTLDEYSRAMVLGNTGYSLRALGRLKEASQPMQVSLEILKDQENWLQSAKVALNLSELYLTIGDVKQALALTEQGIQFADKSGDEFTHKISHSRFAYSLLQAGQLEESRTAFREAEKIHKKSEPRFPILYSDIGFQYCDLLMSLGDYGEVEQRASQTLEWTIKYGLSHLSIALDNLSLGRAHLFQSQREPNNQFVESLTYLNRAMDGFRQGGYQEFIALGLLARGEYYRVTGNMVKAQKDLDEVFTIATRGGMGLHLADCHLEFARLNVARFKGLNVQTSQPDNLPTDYLGEARKHLVTAKEMINKMGYHRRDKEVEELEKIL